MQYVLKRDKKNLFKFAPLQSSFGRELLLKHGKNPDDLDTMYLVREHGTSGENVIARGRAAVFVLRQLGGASSFFGSILWILPTFLLNFGYNLVASNRNKIAGRYESCPIPTPHEREKFIEL